MKLKTNPRFACGIWYFGACGDRFKKDGYREDIPLEKRLELVASVEGLEGVEFHYPSELNEDNLERILAIMKDLNLRVANVGPYLHGYTDFRFGSLTNPNPEIRRKAIELVKGAAEIAEKAGCNMTIMWLGPDGFDYPFQTNYAEVWDWLIDSLKEITSSKPNHTFCLEYKPYEPRCKSFVDSIGTSLSIIEAVGAKNLGINIDLGHALMGGENLAASASLALKRGRLFHLHLNDAWKRFDDDLVFGSVHFIEQMELLFWLDYLGFNGWYSFDLFPYREDPEKATEESLGNLRKMREILTRIDEKSLLSAIAESDATKLTAIIREAL
jgi:xylose isomerase